jgi:hypothetical protein
MSEAGVFELVKLETPDGVVGWARIPRFRPCADVLVWGQRIFRYRDVVAGTPGHVVYREAFSFFIVSAVTARPEDAQPFPAGTT